MKNRITKIIDCKEHIGKTVEEVRNTLLREYPKDGWELAGQEYCDWIVKQTDVPGLEEKYVWFHFMKDIFRVSDGNWNVPSVNRDGSGFERLGDWLDGAWHSNDRVVLVSSESFIKKEYRRDTIKYMGECAKDASARLGEGENLVRQRIKELGWSIEDAFTIPAEETLKSEPLPMTFEKLFIDLEIKIGGKKYKITEV